MEMMMPGYRTLESAERPPVNTTTPCGLTAVDRDCIKQLIGHRLAIVEREFILQTLKSHRGNRTRAADLLGISIRSLRDRIRNYRSQGQDVPAPESAGAPTAAEGSYSGLRH
jgi:two-component system, response regulator FlrC